MIVFQTRSLEQRDDEIYSEEQSRDIFEKVSGSVISFVDVLEYDQKPLFFYARGREKALVLYYLFYSQFVSSQRPLVKNSNKIISLKQTVKHVEKK